MTRNFIWPELPAALHEIQPWARPGIEPPLREVLADPLVQAVMRRDGVSRAALESVVAHAQQRLRQYHDCRSGFDQVPESRAEGTVVAERVVLGPVRDQTWGKMCDQSASAMLGR